MEERITELLERLKPCVGVQPMRAEIIGELVTLLANELRQRASRLMSREAPGHELQTTALFHETYMRLVTSKMTFADQQLFLCMSSRIMRQILVDAARSHTRLRNNSGNLTALDFDSADRAAVMDPAVLIDLDDALNKLPKEDAGIVDMIFFYGLTLQEAAVALETNYETLRRQWYGVRRKLYTRLQGRVQTAG